MDSTSASATGLHVPFLTIPLRNARRRVLALLMAVAPFSASADVGFTMYVDAYASDNLVQCWNDSSLSNSWSVACGSSADGQAASGSATATVGTGHLGVTTTSVADSSFSRDRPFDAAVAHTHATAYLNDTMRIDSPSHSGWGTLTFRLYLDRTASLSATALAAEGQVQALGDATVDVLALAHLGSYSNQGQADGLRVDYSRSSGTTTTRSSSGMVNNVPVESGLGYQTFTVPFLFNETTSLLLELRGHSFAEALGNAAGAATLTAMNSLDWGGIVGVSVDGVAVHDYTVSSTSGTDWTKNYAPVPEPATGALTLAGLAALALAAQRRRAKQAA